jgi:predicted N-formylglutamate amidohydrolase
MDEQYDKHMTYTPFEIIGENRDSRWLVTADHASNTVPDFINGGDLGLDPDDMQRHIAFDPGTAGVTRALARLLGAPAILGNFSRLVIDANRGEDDPTLLMKLYDGTIIPANRHAGDAERDRRLDLLHRPYHRALARLATRRADTVLVPIHSFTRQLAGQPPRPWHIAILHTPHSGIADALLERLTAEPGLCVGDNRPYGGYLPGDSVDRHATAHGHMNALIEIRNDLIRTPQQQTAWAERLAPILRAALADTGR